MKVVYTGIESSGKSLMLAKKAKELVVRNAKWNGITGESRNILSNIKFSSEFENYARELGVIIEYYDNISDIIYRKEVDVFIDELIKYFDARNWLNLTLDAKHWITQGAKSGVHVYGSAQDFSQVEKQFRLLCNEVYVIKKIIGSRRPMKTSPAVKRVWGLCSVRQVDPRSFKGDNVTMDSLSLPSFFFIEKADTDIFDTNATVTPSDLPPIKKYRREVLHIEKGEVIERKSIWQ